MLAQAQLNTTYCLEITGCKIRLLQLISTVLQVMSSWFNWLSSSSSFSRSHVAQDEEPDATVRPEHRRGTAFMYITQPGNADTLSMAL